MSMTVGELVGYIDVEDRPFHRSIDSVERKFHRLDSAVSSTSGSIESTVASAFARVADAIGDGMDPDEALADLAQLVDGVEDALKATEREARRGGRRTGMALTDELGDALAAAEDVAGVAGERAGDAFVRGADGRLRDGRGRFVAEGKNLFDGLGDGAERNGSRITSSLGSAFDVAQAGVAGVLGVSKFATVAVVGLGVAALATAAAVAAIGGALTLGVVGLGAFLAANKEVKKELTDLGKSALEVFQKAAAPLRGPILDGLERLQGKILPLGDMLAEVFRKSAPLITKAFDVALDVIDNLIDKLPGIVERGMPVAEFFLNTLGGAVSGFFNFIAWGLVKIEEFKAAWNDSGTTLGAWAARVGEIVAQVKAFFGDVFATVQQWIGDNQGKISEWGASLESGWKTASDAISSAVELISLLWDEFGDDILDQLANLVDTFLGIWNGLWQTIGGILETAIGLFTGDWDRAAKGLEKIWDGLWKIVESILVGAVKSIGNQMLAAWEYVTGITNLSWSKVTKTISDAVKLAVTYVKSIPDKIKAGLGNLGALLVQAGRDLINGLVNGIKATASQAVDAAKGVVKSAVDGAKNLLGISSPSRVFAEIGRWTVEGLIQGLTSEEGRAVDTVKRMVDQIKAAFASMPETKDHLLAFVTKGNDSLAKLADQREALVKRLAEAKEYAKQVAGDAAEWASITGLSEEELNSGDFSGALKSRAQQIKDFANDIKRLAERGLNKTTLKQIIDAGVEGGGSLAEMLVGADGSEIKAINRAQKQIDNMSKQLGKSGADALYDVGKKAGDGYLKGLQDSLKKIDAEMTKIVKALVSAIKRELKIKSPSQVMADVGLDTMAGLALGITAGGPQAISAITGVATQIATQAAGSLGRMVSGMQPGGPVDASVATAGGRVGGSAGTGLDGVSQGPPPASGVTVNVNMAGANFPELADTYRIGSDIGFNVMAQGLV
ncbi:hypothetical protein ACIBKY_52050 [Nonomuraea sp. NPDC050394]|uniref:hypothetical protein n=1 Tax=Nonomuraea sp. NPDC050394 TaxID=3364363 RepID=UPI0037A0A378